VGLKLNGTHQHLAYADDVNLLGNYIDTSEKNTETYSNKEVGLEINVEKTKYMLLSCHHNVLVGRNRDITIANRFI
jgi:hypothetical protein